MPSQTRRHELVAVQNNAKANHACGIVEQLSPLSNSKVCHRLAPLHRDIPGRKAPGAGVECVSAQLGDLLRATLQRLGTVEQRHEPFEVEPSDTFGAVEVRFQEALVVFVLVTLCWKVFDRGRSLE